MNHTPGTVFFGLILVVLGFPVSTGAADLPESAAARVRWFDEIVDLSRPTDILAPRVISSPGGVDTEVRIDSQLGNRYHIFLPHRSPPADLASPGTVIIRQRDSDGAIDQMKVFLQHDEGTFFRLRPRSSRRSLEMDLYLAGREWYRDVTVPISLERAVRAPISEIQDLTAGIVDWDVVRPQFDRAEYRAIADIVRRIRHQLPQLSDADDGAMDADGSYVSIESLGPLDEGRGFNCSGFAKWIVDGLYQPLTGTLMSVDTLREKHLDHRGTRWSRRVEETRDPYFGLDWTRNLAREIHAVHRAIPSTEIDPEARDVRSVPIARYRDDVGFPVDDLGGIIYWLAVAEPGMIFLGSVNGSFGEEPVVRQHSHVVVILPYFDAEGRFYPVVMERNAETGLERFTRRYDRAFIHLVRVRATSPFDAPELTSPAAR